MGVFFLFIIFFLLNQLLFSFYQKRHIFFNRKKLNLLYFYHFLFFGIYYWYASFNPSDSHRYFDVISNYNGSWIDLFGTDTAFIHFLGYPFFKLGFNYEMLMLLFSWFGFLGFLYAYLFFREKVPVKIKVFKYIDFLSLILFLPNMHFWTASLGKGAPVFLGLMMFTYAVTKPKSRIWLLVLSSIIIFYTRPHVFLFVAVGAVLGYMSGKEKIPLTQKILIYTSLITVLILAQDQILAVVNLQESENLIEDFQDFSAERAEDLSRSAGSGVDINSYPLPLKLFTFWFRPLFFDAPGAMGVIVSFENLIYLLLFIKILSKNFLKFIWRSPSFVKMSLIIFFTTSFAMTFVTSNLGIIMRQKSMIMYYIFFVIFYYLAQKKYKKIIEQRRSRERVIREMEVVV